jgi:hypothetical protein
LRLTKKTRFAKSEMTGSAPALIDAAIGPVPGRGRPSLDPVYFGLGTFPAP